MGFTVATTRHSPQTTIQVINDTRPVRIFNDLLFKKRFLGGRPKWRPVEGYAIIQRAVSGNEVFYSGRIRRQSELGEQIAHRVQVGFHKQFPFADFQVNHGSQKRMSTEPWQAPVLLVYPCANGTMLRISSKATGIANPGESVIVCAPKKAATREPGHHQPTLLLR